MEFVMLGLRESLQLIERCCFHCRKRKASTVHSMMSATPFERLALRHRPFTNSGVVHFGPFCVIDRRSSEKRWAFLFACMTTRTVNIETVPSLDTCSCIMGFEKFMACRSTLCVVWSENDTNFVRAEKALLLCVESWNRQALSMLVHKRIE